MASVAALISWCCMFITYLRWHKGFQRAVREQNDFEGEKVTAFVKDHRARGQPYVRISPILAKKCVCTDVLPDSLASVDRATPLCRYLGGEWVVRYGFNSGT